MQDQKALLEGFFSVLTKLQLLALIIAGVQVLAAVLLISNTIRVAAYSRRRETGIMRLVGASNLYIQLPFLLEGVLAGLVGAAFASGALLALKEFLIDRQLRPTFEFTAFVGWDDVLAILPVLFLTGAAARRSVLVRDAASPPACLTWSGARACEPDRVRTRRSPARAATGIALALALLGSTAPAQAGPAPRAQTPEQDRLAEAERRTLADLAESSAQVRSAAVALSSVAAQLPGAQSAVAKARGSLAGARAKVAAATAELEQAERDLAAATAQVDAADARVEQGRRDVGAMARRTYQRGRLGDVREVVDAGDPQDVLERAAMLRSVFKHQDAALDRLTTARLALASRQASVAAERRAVARARERAQEREERARDVAGEAEDAAARVRSLLATRASALRSAEGARAADQADYAQAQAASRALAERIREAARRAAEAEARRKAQAEAEARRKAQAEAAARAAAARAAAAATAAQRREAARAAAASADAARRASRRSRPAAPDDAPSVASSVGWLWPCGGCPQTSSFGWRTHPIFGDRRLHAGIDMGAPIGTTVRAAEGGTVLIAGSASGYGTLVVVGHGGGLSTAYAHMSAISVSPGQSVGRGEKVGEVGNEGNSTGPHLHFEVRSDGEPVDPSAYVGGS